MMKKKMRKEKKKKKQKKLEEILRKVRGFEARATGYTPVREPNLSTPRENPPCSWVPQNGCMSRRLFEVSDWWSNF